MVVPNLPLTKEYISIRRGHACSFCFLYMIKHPYWLGIRICQYREAHQWRRRDFSLFIYTIYTNTSQWFSFISKVNFHSLYLFDICVHSYSIFYSSYEICVLFGFSFDICVFDILFHIRDLCSIWVLIRYLCIRYFIPHARFVFYLGSHSIMQIFRLFCTAT